MLNRKNANSQGFTLIELLIVIVIIGILAGVLVSIINPAEQQNRARDANVKATLNKVALATQGYISAYGEVPDDIQFLGALDNAQDLATPTCAGGDVECIFSVTGNALPTTTDTNACNGTWAGSGTDQCYYRYNAVALGGTVFELYAKSFGQTDTVYRYRNDVGEIQECDVNGANCL